MAFWNRKSDKQAPEAEPGTFERVRSLERQLSALQDDFLDLADRFKRFQGRWIKRASLDANAEPVEAPPGGPDEASARILSLRTRAKVRPGGIK